MKSCPVCGYDPEPAIKHVSNEDLKRQQIENHFKKNALQYWWLSQPRVVCKWLKEQIWSDPMVPETIKAILDVGCGDGRWYPAVSEWWPEAHYTGVERLLDHHLNNREIMPNVDWVLSDITRYVPIRQYDLVLIMGTLNPKMPENQQKEFFKKILELRPDYIACLFDLNNTGDTPDKYIKSAYVNAGTYVVPKEEKNPRQDLVVWLYEQHGQL